jgi:hypothetical protein
MQGSARAAAIDLAGRGRGKVNVEINGFATDRRYVNRRAYRPSVDAALPARPGRGIYLLAPHRAVMSR